MSETTALLITFVSLGSCYACYRIGRDEEKKKWIAWLRQHYPTSTRHFPE